MPGVNCVFALVSMLPKKQIYFPCTPLRSSEAQKKQKEKNLLCIKKNAKVKTLQKQHRDLITKCETLSDCKNIKRTSLLQEAGRAQTTAVCTPKRQSAETQDRILGSMYKMRTKQRAV